MVLGVLTIIAGGLMQLLKWEFAIPTLTTGLTIVTAYILKDIFNSEKKEKRDNNNEEIRDIAQKGALPYFIVELRLTTSFCTF
ncbi:hypothetical protein NYZ99_08065 [Maribacter litopenaei]|uniref:Uncharacterized protein n=1 Tax=Maribacter litopenaei TaxID=2976127 RepID=A0ABY5YAX0_9FLAO|nr:hypothetical protein [Maribacter litopenaei]UWX56197.1 hypothetical protein NYZ99_08065 [Maribacter litopenaei]